MLIFDEQNRKRNRIYDTTRVCAKNNVEYVRK